MATNSDYTVLSEAQITKTRTAVVSRHVRGGFTIAQQFQAVEGDQIVKMFMKGAFHVDSVGGLIALRDAIDEAIAAVNNEM